MKSSRRDTSRGRRTDRSRDRSARRTARSSEESRGRRGDRDDGIAAFDMAVEEEDMRFKAEKRGESKTAGPNEEKSEQEAPAGGHAPAATSGDAERSRPDSRYSAHVGRTIQPVASTSVARKSQDAPIPPKAAVVEPTAGSAPGDAGTDTKEEAPSSGHPVQTAAAVGPPHPPAAPSGETEEQKSQQAAAIEKERARANGELLRQGSYKSPVAGYVYYPDPDPENLPDVEAVVDDVEAIVAREGY